MADQVRHRAIKWENPTLNLGGLCPQPLPLTTNAYIAAPAGGRGGRENKRNLLIVCCNMNAFSAVLQGGSAESPGVGGEAGAWEPHLN